MLATNKFKVVEKSQKFKQWENLSEKEKTGKVQPSYFDISTKSTVRRSTYNKLLGNSTETENYYDLSKEISSINVKNQKLTNSCWAFSFSNALETTLEKKYNGYGKQFSGLHMEYVTTKMYNKKLGNAGNAYMALAYCLNEYGPVLEEDFKFNDYYNEETNSSEKYYLKDEKDVNLEKSVAARVEEATYFASIYKFFEDASILYLNEYYTIETEEDLENAIMSEEEVELNRNLIKKHIKEKGAVTAGAYMDIKNENGKWISAGGYYNEDNKSYCCTTTEGFDINHAVTIIGWKDDYKKENFNEDNRPVNDGAYIVLNTWGTEFGNDGYFYIAYDDVFIEQMVVGIDTINKYDEDTYYDKLYQYDELGMSHFIQAEGAGSAYSANVFEREVTEETEYLTEVGIYMATTEGVEVYVNANDGDLSKGELVASYKSSNALESGYHTIKIEPIELKGDKFVVKVKYINDELVTLPIESDLFESGFTETSTIYDSAISHEKESYISLDGEEWDDLYNCDLGDGCVLKNTNVCIKAFSIYAKPATVDVKDVKLDKTNITLLEGTTESLIATIEPTDATNKNISWGTSDEKVATVENGVVTAIKEGTATITVTTEDGEKTATCEVTVQAKAPEIIKVESVNLNKTQIIMKTGETESLIATIEPSNATNKNITWSTSNEEVATVDGGVVTAIAKGETIITVTTEDGEKTKTCKVIVDKEEVPEEIKVKSVELDKTKITMIEGTTESLIATVEPSDATNKNIEWSTSDEEVATVENGVVTAVKEGTATITVTTEDGGKIASCEVTVQAKEPEVIKVESVSLNKTQIIMKIGETESLIETVKPSNATNKNIEWSTSDEEVATVENGVVTAVKEGTATITVTTEDGGKTASCKVIVDKEEIPEEIKVEKVELDKTKITLVEGTTESLIATISPSNATNKRVEWNSSDEEVAIVENGVVTAVKEGIATITVTTEDGGKIANCKVTVQEKEQEEIKVESVDLDKSEIELDIGETESLIVEISPSNATNKRIEWSSSNEEVATVENGIVTAKKNGETTIKVITEDGRKEAVCKVKVTKNNAGHIAIEKIEFNKTNAKMQVGESISLLVTYTPNNATNLKLKWESSDDKVVTVTENGIIKAVGEGDAQIKAISEDGNKEAICKITVTKKTNNDDDIYDDKDDDTVAEDKYPVSGVQLLISFIAIILVIGIIKFIGLRKLKDIK